MSHHVIYVPGFGDSKSSGQKTVIQIWRLFGLHPHYLALGWSRQEGFGLKLDRLQQLIDELSGQGHTVSLVGVSAGASAVLNAYKSRKNIHKVVCISGKINRPEQINQNYFIKNPDFKEAVFGIKAILQSLSPAELKKIMSTHPRYDQIVPIDDTKIPGSVEKALPGRSHATGIFIALTVGAPAITGFIKSS